jgi:diketogulonate reductase-like aldo/keto reductase
MLVVESNGAQIPAVGLGTLFLKEAACVETVAAALQAGYRHIDTAQMYGNEREVGEGLKASGVPREQVFVTTKVWWNKLAPADFAASVEESLEKLGLSFVDLLLIHWNNPHVPLTDSIGALCKAKRDKLTKHIGVANFTTALLDQAVKIATEPLVTNQVEAHPYIDHSKLAALCRKHGIAITAYCPLARGKVPGDEVLARIGKEHGKTASQVALRWLLQQGEIVIPRTSKRERLAENLAVEDFRLINAEMAEIAALKRPDGRLVSPPHAPKWDD